MRVGILGGAFNPPHIGHLVGAQEALLQLELERVVFVPMGVPPHRDLEDDPGAEVRVEMIDLAIAEDPRFELSRIEAERDEPSYTAGTLTAMRKADPELEPFLILGGDQAAALPEWHEPERVLELATVAAVERVNWSRSAIAIKIARLRGADRVRYLDMPLMQVSSTSIRRRVREGRPIRYLVPDAVEDVIVSRGLYGGSGAARGDGAAASGEKAEAPA